MDEVTLWTSGGFSIEYSVVLRVAQPAIIPSMRWMQEQGQLSSGSLVICEWVDPSGFLAHIVFSELPVQSGA